jgi:hypothetical protein
MEEVIVLALSLGDKAFQKCTPLIVVNKMRWEWIREVRAE